ncbi:MAG: hypothetical protein N4A33_04485 [Bacteriovoracaceae bacterium]|jgi:uncharacterized membrane protein|nr:hypothetical protein [Bacteriovoracaceae bacterium]
MTKIVYLFITLAVCFQVSLAQTLDTLHNVKQINKYSALSQVDKLKFLQKNKKKVLKSLDLAIKKERRKNRSLEDSKSLLTKKMKKYKKTTQRKIEKILSSKRKLTRYQRRLKKLGIDITINELSETLKSEQSNENFDNLEREMLLKLDEAGSLERFLKDIRLQIEKDRIQKSVRKSKNISRSIAQDISSGTWAIVILVVVLIVLVLSGVVYLAVSAISLLVVGSFIPITVGVIAFVVVIGLISWFVSLDSTDNQNANLLV